MEDIGMLYRGWEVAGSIHGAEGIFDFVGFGERLYGQLDVAQRLYRISCEALRLRDGDYITRSFNAAKSLSLVIRS
jgi:hypothetical protein